MCINLLLTNKKASFRKRIQKFVCGICNVINTPHKGTSVQDIDPNKWTHNFDEIPPKNSEHSIPSYVQRKKIPEKNLLIHLTMMTYTGKGR